MKNQIRLIPKKNIKRLETQGFTGYSHIQLSEHRSGIRFAYQLCVSLVIIGLAFKSIKILAFLLVMALMAAFSTRHPFDFIYNYGVRHLINKPKTPKRAIQGNIACGIATSTLAIIIYSFHFGFLISAYIVGGMLVFSALLVSITDICIPSVLMHYLRKFKSHSKNYDYL